MSGRLLYSMSVSADGFAADAGGSLEWIAIDEELHAFFNDEARATQTSLYGRRMYELMAGYWPDADADPSASPAVIDFARIWRATPKVVFSRTLREVAHGARLVSGDAVREVARLKAEGLTMDVSGPTLAGAMLRAGLIDEVHLFVHPVILGAGLRFFPPLDEARRLSPLGRRSFASGVELLRYAVEQPVA